jgi:hypothetical protein
VVADIVADVAATQEGGLGDVNEEVQGALEAVRHDKQDELDVAVEQGDGAVPCQLIAGLARLRKEADDPTEEGFKGGVVACPVLEGPVEDLEEGWDEEGFESAVELIREAIMARARTSLGLRQRVLKVFSGQQPVAIEALGEGLPVDGETVRERGEERVLGCCIGSLLLKKADRRIRGVEIDGILQSQITARAGAQVSRLGVAAFAPAGTVEGADSDGWVIGTGEGVEVVGGRVPEQVIQEPQGL